MLKHLLSILIIIVLVSLLVPGWTTAKELDIDKESFREKLRLYFNKAQTKIMSALEKPLNAINSWFNKKTKEVKKNFYEELEEMKISLIELFKKSWSSIIESQP